MTLESTGAVSMAKWVESFSDTRKSLVPSPALRKPGLEARACNPSIWDVEEGGSEMQGHLQLPSKAETKSGQLIRLTVATHPGKL